MISPINLDEKHTGERSAGQPHAAFDVAGAGNVLTAFGTSIAVDVSTLPTAVDTAGSNYSGELSISEYALRALSSLRCAFLIFAASPLASAWLSSAVR